ncbi:hypothetical protein MMC21_003688 [Puttea exsequens]|nr:hypothetical protein [Puttea exsequens]
MNRYSIYSQAPLVQGSREIRILNLGPGQFDDPLRGNLIIESLDYDDLHYTALSYTWSGATDKSMIYINKVPLRITENLESALRQFRGLTRPKNIWVDAICINQSDDKEKGFQVAMMGSIYACATRTWIWLGEESVDSDVAMHFIQSCRYENPDMIIDTSKTREIPSRAVVSLLTREWWTRIWVVQEVLLSPRALFHCGSQRVDLRRFAQFATSQVARKLFQEANPSEVTPSRKQQPFIRLFSGWYGLKRSIDADGLPLRDLLRLTCAFNSSIRRDKLFALRALTRPETQSWIIPDYSDAVADRLILTSVTMYFLQISMEPLRLATYWPDNESPSWVADWTSVDEWPIEMLYYKHNDDTHRSSTTTPKQISVYDQEQLLSTVDEAANFKPRFEPPIEKLARYQIPSVLMVYGEIIDEVKNAAKMPSLYEFPAAGPMQTRIRNWELCVDKYVQMAGLQPKTKATSNKYREADIPPGSILRRLLDETPNDPYYREPEGHEFIVEKLSGVSKLAFRWYRYLRLAQCEKDDEYDKEYDFGNDLDRFADATSLNDLYAACMQSAPCKEDASFGYAKTCLQCGEKAVYAIDLEQCQLCALCANNVEKTIEEPNMTRLKRQQVSTVFSTSNTTLKSQNPPEASLFAEPLAIEIGDVACRLQFSDWLFVLRRTEEDCWKMVGHIRRRHDRPSKSYSSYTRMEYWSSISDYIIVSEPESDVEEEAEKPQWFRLR